MSESKHTAILDIKEIRWTANTTIAVEFNPETFLGYEIVGKILLTACNNYDALKARVAQLEEALKQFMSWLESGLLVRDITHDYQFDWPLKMMQFVNELNKIQALLKTEAANG